MTIQTDRSHFEGIVLEKKYHLRALVHAGGLSEVYLADEMADGQKVGEVTVKLLRAHPEIAPTLQREQLLRMLRFDHQHIVRGLHFGEADINGTPVQFLIMERTDGSLEDRLARGRLTTDEVRVLARHMAAALQYLHQLTPPVAHVNLHPANILRVGDAWKLTDVGPGPEMLMADGRVAANVYSPPELHTNPAQWNVAQSSVKPIAWDIWSFGMIILEALSGQRLPAAGGRHQFLTTQAGDIEIPYTIADEFRPMLQGCLRFNPRGRWSAMRLMTELSAPTLTGVNRTWTVSTRRRNRGAIIAGVLLLCLGLGLFLAVRYGGDRVTDTLKAIKAWGTQSPASETNVGASAPAATTSNAPARSRKAPATRSPATRSSRTRRSSHGRAASSPTTSSPVPDAPVRRVAPPPTLHPVASDPVVVPRATRAADPPAAATSVPSPPPASSPSSGSDPKPVPLPEPPPL